MVLVVILKKKKNNLKKGKIWKGIATGIKWCLHCEFGFAWNGSTWNQDYMNIYWSVNEQTVHMSLWTQTCLGMQIFLFKIEHPAFRKIFN